MRKILGTAVLLTTVTTSLLAQKKVTINANVLGDTKGYDKVYIYGQLVKSDSFLIKNGKLALNVPFEKPFMVFLYTEYQKKAGGMTQPFGILIDRPGTITLKDMDIVKGPRSAKLSGLESAVTYEKWKQLEDEAGKKIVKDLTDKYGKPWMEKEDRRYDELEEYRTGLRKKYIGDLIEDFVSKYPDSHATLVGLSTGRELLSPDKLVQTVGRLSKRLQGTADAKALVDFAAGVKNSAIGNTIENFTLNTPEGTPLNYNETFKGKYVLIDFWASWCGPCIQSFPHMKEIYKKYKSDKFEIYSISIDQSKEAWLKGAKEQNLPWPQTLDTENVSKRGFAITGVPTTYLISPEGKILAKDVGFDPSGNGNIEKMIRELFDAKSDSKVEDKRPKTIKATRM